jgi:hypothetical protein
MAGEGVSITEAQFLATFGQRNDAFLTEWLGHDAGPARLKAVGEAKESCYRRLVEEGAWRSCFGRWGSKDSST